MEAAKTEEHNAHTTCSWARDGSGAWSGSGENPTDPDRERRDSDRLRPSEVNHNVNFQVILLGLGFVMVGLRASNKLNEEEDMAIRSEAIVPQMWSIAVEKTEHPGVWL